MKFLFFLVPIKNFNRHFFLGGNLRHLLQNSSYLMGLRYIADQKVTNTRTKSFIIYFVHARFDTRQRHQNHSIYICCSASREAALDAIRSLPWS